MLNITKKPPRSRHDLFFKNRNKTSCALFLKHLFLGVLNERRRVYGVLNAWEVYLTKTNIPKP